MLVKWACMADMHAAACLHRYHVLDKLVNFMAPVELVPPPFATQLFSNLFGYKQRTVQ